MDKKLSQQLGKQEFLRQLSDWIEYQLKLWEKWAQGRDTAWLGLETGNQSFPTIGHFFRHAFSPLHRYSDQVEGLEPVVDTDVPTADWAALLDWARLCHGRHHSVMMSLKPEWFDRELEFKTRSAGVFKVAVGGALTHAATHCVWHLSGMVHLLRSKGIEPPARSDLLFMLAARD